jgi:phosphomannomutase
MFIKELGENPLKGLRLAVDAGNGAAGFYATRILQPLGADISGSQFLEPDGNFPNHEPNPESKTAMQSISQRVTETNSELGIIFDTDGDRSAIVLKSGKEVNRNRLIAMISAIILRTQKNAHIVTDSVTSEGLREFITNLGGTHIRYKRGYQNVISYAKKLIAEGKNAPLAIETSGHTALKDNYFLDDGAYLAALLIIEAVKLKRENKELNSLIKDLKEPIEEATARVTLLGGDIKKTGESVLSALTQLSQNYRVADDSFEGIRTFLLGGYFMARMSVHDPVIPINIETEKQGTLKQIAEVLIKALDKIENIDITALKALLN